MRSAEVLYNGERVGVLTETKDRTYVFRYDEAIFNNPNKPIVSLTLSKNQQEHESPHLFPFFFNLIAEGANLSLQSRYLKIDKQDHFGILCATSQCDTIGPVTVTPIS